MGDILLFHTVYDTPYNQVEVLSIPVHTGDLCSPLVLRILTGTPSHSMLVWILINTVVDPSRTTVGGKSSSCASGNLTSLT